jgi:hypothetical protein
MEKKKELRFLVTPLFFKALQDGLGFKKMKSVEIFGNHKKLKNNKL